MPAPIRHWAPFFSGDHWPRLSVSDAQADPWATAQGSAEVIAVSGPPAHPYRAGHDLILADSVMPPCSRSRPDLGPCGA
jgi:hypothetical protein